MADNVSKINIDTSIDNSGLKKGLKESEKTTVDVGKKIQAELDKVEGKFKETGDAAADVGKQFKEGVGGGANAIGDFARGAAGELLGLDQILGAVAGGPVALGKMTVE
ncbi:hypothetical protein FACS189450_10210 [Spirochaetia bacterium]|nr:hypothetical protein FACS189450_10210 [Spirochaetia bacterium]